MRVDKREERRRTNLKGKHTNGPPVNDAAIHQPQKLLRRHVHLGAHPGVGTDVPILFCLVLQGNFGGPKICNYQMPVAIDQNVLGLEVSVDYALLVQALYCQHQLRQVEAGFVLAERRLLLQDTF